MSQQVSVSKFLRLIQKNMCSTSNTKHRLQSTLEYMSTALYYALTCTGAIHITSAAFLLLLFTRLWFLVALYLLWAVYDWNTQKKGGRKFGNDFMRGLPVFRYMRDYYPITLEKTAGLDPKRNYIFGYHPHGYILEGAVVGMVSDACGFRDLFPGITPHMTAHSSILHSFLFREILLSLGFVDVARESLECALTHLGPGHSVIVVVGGAAEVMNAKEGLYALTLKNRKGFAKLALETGSPLVPVIAFGQNDVMSQLFNTMGSRFWHFNLWLRKMGRKYLGVTLSSIVLIHGRFGILMPYRTPVNIVVGRPIPVSKIAQPSQKEVDALHSRYLRDLRELFDNHKSQYNVPKGTELLYL
ncbi:2-acylglycerol O-acyltransferase 2 isoform X2 [Nematostella vectensis]|uniref:2-acylglycerol O-acyltransferase 2 isoform X2 n=1 Tax=Nematostella vectensis TaxID=45351 RepID=UPI00207734AC|nr:2-acylglycerol O-acyltransferase 2 isoform X2 [Nematostella vectensis]